MEKCLHIKYISEYSFSTDLEFKMKNCLNKTIKFNEKKKKIRNLNNFKVILFLINNFYCDILKFGQCSFASLIYFYCIINLH